jgi:hypothetical protein
VTCEHLRALEGALAERGFKESFRGQAWSKACREWVYFDVYLDREAIRARFRFDDCVVDHEHLGTHDGAEEGFVCSIHHDGVMGIHRRHLGESLVRVYRGEA